MRGPCARFGLHRHYWPPFLLLPCVHAVSHMTPLFSPLKGLPGFLLLLPHFGFGHMTSFGHEGEVEMSVCLFQA